MSQRTYEENQIIREALENYRLPLFTRIFKKTWFYFIKYTFLPAFCLLAIFFIIYNSISYYTEVADTLWTICKTIVLFYIFGIGGAALISHICELISTNRLCKKLNLTKEEFAYYINLYHIKGF